MVMPNGINVGTEHLPRCPDIVEKHNDATYCAESAIAARSSERAVERALDMVTRAIEPLWFKVLLGICFVLRFLRPLAYRLRNRFWSFDGSLDHRAYEFCTWSGELKIPDEGRRLVAALVAEEVLTRLGFTVVSTAFNVAPGSFPVTRSS